VGELEEEPQTPQGVADKIDQIVDVMMQLNTVMIHKARKAARIYMELQSDHLTQAERAFEVAQLCAIGAKLVSDITGDLITAEFDIGDQLFDEYSSQETTDDEEGEEEDEDPSN
jgi:hypothetical protein